MNTGILFLRKNELTDARCLAMMSDMKAAPLTFTPRDLNRQPAKVLAAARKFGSVEVRTRDGETFTLARKQADQKAELLDFKALFEARGKRLRELGCIPAPASENERINRIIAGED